MQSVRGAMGAYSKRPRRGRTRIARGESASADEAPGKLPIRISALEGRYESKAQTFLSVSIIPAIGAILAIKRPVYRRKSTEEP